MQARFIGSDAPCPPARPDGFWRRRVRPGDYGFNGILQYGSFH